MNTILGLLFLYLALNFLILVFFINSSDPSEYDEGVDKW